MQAQRFIALLLAASAMAAAANDPAKDFELLATTASKVAYEAYQRKDYAAANKAYREILAAFARLSPDLQKSESSAAAATYYNIACDCSLMRDAPGAIEALKASAAAGFKDYAILKAEKDLDFIRSSAAFADVLAKVRNVGDYVYILQQGGPYEKDPNADAFPTLRYQDPSDAHLKKLREQYNLDIVAGQGDDVSKITRLMRWAHLTIKHDGSYWPPVDKNALDLIGYAVRERRGINCRCLAISLSECYLAMGFKSHYVGCMPKDPNDVDCHVIVSVYAPSLKKWVYMDPSFGGYFKDEHGTLLSIEEVRDRILHNKPMTVSHELDHNGEVYPEGAYRSYMAKNLYWLTIPVYSSFDYETPAPGKEIAFVHLLPRSLLKQGIPPVVAKLGTKNTVTTDPKLFWRMPSD